MKEKELRIAMVCFGGISLAVYMHGISKEILKLVRASGILHSIPDRGARSHASFFDKIDQADPEYDTEAVYFELLRDIGRTLELRVVVDIIAGASAGGINGTMLARALSHDLPMGALRDLWLDHADITDLLAPEARPRGASKLVLKPLVWLLGAGGFWKSIKDPEVRRKLSLFLRSRWFKPPLSGARMTELMYDAVSAMGEPRDSLASLLPSGQRLDLFVTVTDYYGYRQLHHIHDPPIVHERQHRHVLRFRSERHADGQIASDFVFENAPSLAFAARATSSFPGAFPPAQIREMDNLVAQRSIEWPQRAEFIAQNFEIYTRANIDPASAYFLDGSVLNNRPFREAISAIRDRPAYRQIDRRLIYIDPDPAPVDAPGRRGMPGFFPTLKGALSDLPSAEPVTNEINWVNDYNERIDRIREIVEDAQPRVAQLVAAIVTTSLDQPVTCVQIRSWRERINVQVADDAGFAYESYVRLKLASARAFVSSLIADLRGVPPQSPFAHSIAEIIDAWALATGMVYQREAHQAARPETMTAAEAVPRWMNFLLAFDVDYHKRRLHFLIEGQNRLYQLFDEPHFEGFDRVIVDRLKRSFYDCLDALNRSTDTMSFAASTCNLVEGLFVAAPAPGDADDLKLYARLFVKRHGQEIELLMDRLAVELDLVSSTDGIDKLLASLDPGQWHPDARHDVLINYLGFPFWDVLTFPLMTWRDVGELNKILIDRISPQDAATLPEFGGRSSLKGFGFGHFAAFFSRAYRENDYLLGRIHALDRLIDIVCNSARLDVKSQRNTILGLKLRGFTRILDAEESHLPHCADLIAALRSSIARLSADATEQN